MRKPLNYEGRTPVSVTPMTVTSTTIYTDSGHRHPLHRRPFATTPASGIRYIGDRYPSVRYTGDRHQTNGTMSPGSRSLRTMAPSQAREKPRIGVPDQGADSLYSIRPYSYCEASTYFLKLFMIACQPACWNSTGWVPSASNVSTTFVAPPRSVKMMSTFLPSPNV